MVVACYYDTLNICTATHICYHRTMFFPRAIYDHEMQKLPCGIVIHSLRINSSLDLNDFEKVAFYMNSLTAPTAENVHINSDCYTCNVNIVVVLRAAAQLQNYL
jgi:hypothetical protein